MLGGVGCGTRVLLGGWEAHSHLAQWGQLGLSLPVHPSGFVLVGGFNPVSKGARKAWCCQSRVWLWRSLAGLVLPA